MFLKQIDEANLRDKFQLVDVLAITNLPHYVSSVPCMMDKNTQQVYTGSSAFELLKTMEADGPSEYDINYKGIMFSEIEDSSAANKKCENFSYIGHDPAASSGSGSNEMDDLLAKRTAEVPMPHMRTG
jgi:hypothetical protein